MRLQPAGLANTAWAFTTVGHFDEPLFAVLAKRSEGRMCDFNSQNVANTLWAVAKANRFNEPLFMA